MDSPDMDEHAAEASMHGKVTSILVNASGNESHDEDPVGMLFNLSNVGRYAEDLCSACFPRSYPLRGRPFLIEGSEWLCLCFDAREFSWKAATF